MVIDIHSTVIRIQLRRLITLTAFLLVDIPLFFIFKFQNFLGLSHTTLATILLLGFVIYKILERIMDYNYIYFSNTDDRIVFRYFSMSYFGKKKSSIEIPISQFAGYEIKEVMFGFKKKIVLKHKIGEKEARYPEVSLFALDSEQYSKLIHSLDSISK